MTLSVLSIGVDKSTTVVFPAPFVSTNSELCTFLGPGERSRVARLVAGAGLDAPVVPNGPRSRPGAKQGRHRRP